MPQKVQRFGRFDVNEIAESFPETSDTLLIDTYLTNEVAASSRIFRVYRGSRRTTTRLATNIYMSSLAEEHSGWMTCQMQASSHRASSCSSSADGPCATEILEGPVVFLSVDTPRRDPKDVIFFVNPEDGTPETFIHQK